MRSRIVLLASDGKANHAISKELRVNRKTVIHWRERFAREGMDGLKDRSKPGRKPRLGASVVKRVIEATLHERPNDATHWSTRSLGKHLGVSKSSVQRIWETHNLKPHLVKTFKLSNDPLFVEKLKDVIGLYMNPPENALVFCVDEKSQIQALDRTQPSLPLKKGRAGTMTHDYKRNGTTTLFAALDVLGGEVIGKCMKRHRHGEFLKFLRMIDRQTPKHFDVHLIVDNYCTHKKDKVQEWLEKHPRFHFHFIPTSSSWLNLVERWFAEITRKRIRRGTFKSIKELEQAIYEYIEHNNKDPKPFIWTKKAEVIMKKVKRARSALEIVQNC
jgi:transposase